MSIRKINEQIRRMEQRGSSQNVENQLTHQQMGASVSPPNHILLSGKGQSSVFTETVVLGRQLANAVTMETVVTQSNNEGERLVESLKDQVQPGGILSHLGQQGVIDVLRQHQPANSLPRSEIPGTTAVASAQITQPTTVVALPTTMEERNHCTNTSSNPNPKAVSFSPLPPSRSTPKRLGQSIPGVPLPPTKRTPPLNGKHGGELSFASSALGAVPFTEVQVSHGSGLLSVSPADQIPLSQTSHAAGSLSGGLCAPNGSKVPRPTAPQGSQHRPRGSRWDVPPGGGGAGLRPHLHEFIHARPTAAVGKHNRGATHMDSNNYLCTGKSMHLRCWDFDPGIKQGKSAVVSGEEAGESYNPWPLRSPSQSCSVGTVSSPQGAFSHPRLDQGTMENQAISTSPRQGDTLDLRHDPTGENMDVDPNMDTHSVSSMIRVATHGPNMPRVP